MGGGGIKPVSAADPKRHVGLLGLLGVKAADNSASPESGTPTQRFVLWRENEAAYTIFTRIAGHGQWQRAGMDGTVIGLDGQYLIDYLKLTFKSREIPDVLDDVHCIVDGWVTAQNEQRQQS